MPGINDAPEQVERILEAASEAGAVGIGGIALHLRGEVRGVFFDWLRAHRPDLVARYERLYANGRAYLPAAERRRIERGAGLPRRDPEARAERFRHRQGAGRRAPPPAPSPPPPRTVQTALF